MQKRRLKTTSENVGWLSRLSTSQLAFLSSHRNAVMLKCPFLSQNLKFERRNIILPSSKLNFFHFKVLKKKSIFLSLTWSFFRWQKNLFLSAEFYWYEKENLKKKNLLTFVFIQSLVKLSNKVILKSQIRDPRIL